MNNLNTVLVLCVADPKVGIDWSLSVVEDPNWNPDFRDPSSLQGWFWGEGFVFDVDWKPDLTWAVLEVDSTNFVKDINGKVKFPSGKILFRGSQKEASNFLAESSPQHAVIGATVTVGDNQVARVGAYGRASAGKSGYAQAGLQGYAFAGSHGTAKSGYRAEAGEHGQAKVPKEGIAISGNHGVSIAGDRGTAISGDYGISNAGVKGRACVGAYGRASVIDGIARAGIGGSITIYGTYYGTYENTSSHGDLYGYTADIQNPKTNKLGLLPDTYYKIDRKGNFIPVQSPIKGNLDPGIKDTVKLLRSHGFNTTDSGDGVTKKDLIEEGQALDYPHVASTVNDLDPVNSFKEAKRMQEILGPDWGVQLTYNPKDGYTVLFCSLPKQESIV